VAEPLDPPLRIDWLDRDDLRDDRPGRLGLTFLPGKHGASLRYPGLVYRRELDADLARLASSGVRRLMLLVEDGELTRWGHPAIVESAVAHGIVVDRRPMPDGSPPASPSAMDDVLSSVTKARDDGNVAVACMGGVGRTGVVAACALVAAGWSAADAIDRVRSVRHPEAVETPAQEAFVKAYERHVAGHGRMAKVAP
jgi:protein-tyrosine phosphatase